MYCKITQKAPKRTLQAKYFKNNYPKKAKSFYEIFAIITGYFIFVKENL